MADYENMSVEDQLRKYNKGITDSEIRSILGTGRSTTPRGYDLYNSRRSNDLTALAHRYGYGVSNADYYKGYTPTPPDVYVKLRTWDDYNTKNNTDYDFGDLNYDPNKHDAQYNEAWSSYVKKFKAIPQDEKQFNAYYLPNFKYKGEYSGYQQDKDAEAAGLAPFKYQLDDKVAAEYKALQDAYKAGKLNVDNFWSYAPTMQELTKYATDPEYSTDEAQGPAYSFIGKSASSRVLLDIDFLKKLGYDEKTGFQSLYDSIKPGPVYNPALGIGAGVAPATDAKGNVIPGGVPPIVAKSGADVLDQVFAAGIPQPPNNGGMRTDPKLGVGAGVVPESGNVWDQMSNSILTAAKENERMNKYTASGMAIPAGLAKEGIAALQSAVYNQPYKFGFGFDPEAGITTRSYIDLYENGWQQAVKNDPYKIDGVPVSQLYVDWLKKTPAAETIIGTIMELGYDPANFIGADAVVKVAGLLKAKKADQALELLGGYARAAQKEAALVRGGETAAETGANVAEDVARSAKQVRRDVALTQGAMQPRAVGSPMVEMPDIRFREPVAGAPAVNTVGPVAAPPPPRVNDSGVHIASSLDDLKAAQSAPGASVVESTIPAEDAAKTAYNAQSAAEGARPVSTTLYHGSKNTGLDTISASPATRQWDNATSEFGAFFANKESAALDYAGDAGKVYKVDVRLDKPYEMSYGEFAYYQSPNKAADGTALNGGFAERLAELKTEARALRAKLQSEGYDGIVVRKSNGDIMELASFKDVPVKPSGYMAQDVADDMTLTGTLGKSGSGAAADSGVPTVGANGQPVHQFRTNTMERAKAIGEQAKNDLGFDNYTYTPENAEKWQASADQMIASDKQGTIDQIMASKDLTPEMQHAAATLTPEFEAAAYKAGAGSKEMAFYRQWFEKLAKQGGEAGRKLKAIDTAWVKDTPEGAVIQAQKNVIRSEEKLPPKLAAKIQQKAEELAKQTGLDIEAAKLAVKKKLGLPVLDDADILAISENMKKSAAETDPYMKAMYRSKAMQIVADKELVTGHDKFRSIQRISMLLNPKTLITRNPLGNVILSVTENIKDPLGGVIDWLTSLFTKERTTAINPLPRLGGQAKGAVKGVAEWGKDIRYGVDTAINRGQLELPHKTIWRTAEQKSWATNAVNTVLNLGEKATGRALQLGDRPFYEAALQGRLAELKYLGKDITNPDVFAEAQLFALDRVFQNNSLLAKKAMQVRDALGVVGDLALPFAQTPANVLDKMLDYTPVGFAKALKEAFKPASGKFAQKLFVDRLARAFTGTGLITLGYALAAKGLMTGKLNDDSDVAAAQKRLGINAYSLNLGDGLTYTIDWAMPIAGTLIMGADAYQAGNGKADLLSQIISGGEGAVNSIFNRSFLQSFIKLFSGYNPAAGLANFFMSTPTQFLPTGLNQIAKQIDPYVRSTYDPNKTNTAINQIKSRIPVLRETLPKSADALGNVIENFPQDSQLGKAFENFLDPGYVGVNQNNPVDLEALRLYNSTGETSQFLKVAPKDFTYQNLQVVNGKYVYTPQKHVLTAEEYVKYQTELGKMSVSQIEKLMKSDTYKNTKTTDTDRAKMMSDAINYGNNYAQYVMLRDNGLLPDAVKNKAYGWARILARVLGCSQDDAAKFVNGK